MIARRVVIRGRVQGVGYRYAMVDAATASGVAGWARNRLDGAVEALIEGDADAVERVIAWCRRGPPQAKVTGVEVSEAVPGSVSGGFVIAPTA